MIAKLRRIPPAAIAALLMVLVPAAIAFGQAARGGPGSMRYGVPDPLVMGRAGVESTISKTGTGDLGIGPSSANSVLGLYAGSAGGARTKYGSVTLNGLSLLNGAGIVGSAPSADLQLQAPTGQKVRLEINGADVATIDGTSTLSGPTTQGLTVTSGAGQNLALTCPANQAVDVTAAGATGHAYLSANGVHQLDCSGANTCTFGNSTQAKANGGLTVGSGTAIVHFDHGTVTLVAGSGTATLSSAFEHCACTDATAVAAVKCNVSGSTTMTITGTGTDVVSYVCVN